MNLYIQIKDGLPLNHPIIEKNLLIAFPNIDLNNLPENFARFIKKEPPSVGVYEKLEHYYDWEDDNIVDVFNVVDLSPEEKQEKINSTQTAWSSTGLNSWVFDEESCSFQPPLPYPLDGLKYIWNEEIVNWELVDA